MMEFVTSDAFTLGMLIGIAINQARILLAVRRLQ